MKKKNITLKLIFFISLALVLGATMVFAAVKDSNFKKIRIDNIYAVYDGPDRVHLFYGQRYTLNGNNAYCIEPGVSIDTDIYSSTDNWDISGLDKETRSYLKLVAYYGYDYAKHNTTKYYLAAQELIWEKVSGREVYRVTDGIIDGPRVNVDYEKSEIERLISNHTKLPSFNNETIIGNLGEKFEIVDNNNVLSEFEIYKTDVNNLAINNNKIEFTIPDIRDDYEIVLIRKNYTTKSALLYYDGDNQKLISSGMLDPVVATFKIKANGGTISIKKLDNDNKSEMPKGEASLLGAVYGIYNMDDELVDTLVTGNNNTSKDLPYGNYYIKEMSPSAGYQLDTTVYNVILSEENPDIYQEVYEKVIDRDYEITKVYATDKTEIMTPEVGIKFGIYDKDNNLVLEKITDEEGKIYFTLPYGSYVLKQLTSTKNYEKIEDYNFQITEIGKTINLVVSNKEIKAKLRIIKVDSETKQVIEKGGIKFKIKNIETNEYLCQRVLYPAMKNVCIFETDEKGIFITPYELSSGNYQIEEVEDQLIDGYLWNSQPFKFSIEHLVNVNR